MWPLLESSPRARRSSTSFTKQSYECADPHAGEEVNEFWAAVEPGRGRPPARKDCRMDFWPIVRRMEKKHNRYLWYELKQFKCKCPRDWMMQVEWNRDGVAFRANARRIQ